MLITVKAPKPHLIVIFLNPIKMRRVHVVFHSIGLSCLGGTIFLQMLVFSDILQQGYFKAVEANLGILVVELVISAFALAYFVYLYHRLIRQVR
jgi:hypothetical protein